MTWGQNEWLWVIGIAMAGLISWAITKRYASRRRKLMFTWDSVQLLPHAGLARDELEVSYGDIQLQDPYLLKIILKNMGPTDIASSHFDNDGALLVRFPEGYVAALETDTGLALPLRIGEDFLGIWPQLLKRNASVTLDVLVDGPSRPALESNIIDTDVVQVDTAEGVREIVLQAGRVSIQLPGWILYARVVKKLLRIS